jgi:hypothetical protein
MSNSAQFEQELELRRQIARCDREIAEIAARDPEAQPAYLTVLGINDWEHEKRLLQSLTPAIEAAALGLYPDRKTKAEERAVAALLLAVVLVLLGFGLYSYRQLERSASPRTIDFRPSEQRPASERAGARSQAGRAIRWRGVGTSIAPANQVWPTGRKGEINDVLRMADLHVARQCRRRSGRSVAARPRILRDLTLAHARRTGGTLWR